MKLLRQEMNKHMDKGKFKFLIDGFPRNQENIDGWSQEFADGSAHINFVLFLECPESVMEQRLLERGKISGRVDDNIDAIKKRFKTFLENTAPVMTQYEAKGLLRVVDATRTVDDVFDSVCKVFLAHEEETKLVGTRKPEAIFVIGGPGAGKGTQCAKISKTFGYLHLSTGDLLREAVNKGDSEEEKLIQTYQAEGKLVPVSRL
jgi:adenylate kinase family enzyme